MGSLLPPIQVAAEPRLADDPSIAADQRFLEAWHQGKVPHLHAFFRARLLRRAAESRADLSDPA